MSGPVGVVDAPPTLADAGHPTAPCMELSDSREATVGKIRVRRALPRREDLLVEPSQPRPMEEGE